jgi:hypothetical protein
MSILGKFFKSDDTASTKNSEILNALKILQNSSLPDNERAAGLTKLKSIFATSSDKDDLKVISQSMLGVVTAGESQKLRESALTTFDTMIENCVSPYAQTTLPAASKLKLNAISGPAVPVLIEIARYRNEDLKELRRTAYWTLSKLVPYAISEERLGFLAHSLSDKTDNIRLAVITTYENLMRVADDALKNRIARYSLSALCQALDDSAIWVRAARTLGGLGKYALGAAPFLFKRLDDPEGEWAAGALRSITGEPFGSKEKQKWEQWLQKNVVR